MRFYRTVRCEDGLRLSVQANEATGCSPRESGAERYTTVEVGFPSEPIPELLQWAEEPHHPTETVYLYVPVEVVRAVIQAHGGLASGEVPPGVLD